MRLLNIFFFDSDVAFLMLKKKLVGTWLMVSGLNFALRSLAVSQFVALRQNNLFSRGLSLPRRI